MTVHPRSPQQLLAAPPGWRSTWLPIELENRLLPLALSGSSSILGWRLAQSTRCASSRLERIDFSVLHYYALFVNKIPVGVLGASGYAGRELCALILTSSRALARLRDGERAARHDRRASAAATSRSSRPTTPRSSDAELVFSALPHGASKEWVGRAREAGARAVDLSADLRPGNGCEGIAYGLTELNRALVSGAELVANPGCYPTSILLALAPLVARGLVAEARRSSPTRRAA